MGEAIFGLLGVVIGGLLTGTIGYLSELRREARQTRADARLILMNYRPVAPYIKEATNSGVWPPLPENLVWSYNLWVTARPHFGSTLSLADWDALQDGMRIIEDVMEKTGQGINAEERARLPAQADRASKAVATLANLAGKRVFGVG